MDLYLKFLIQKHYEKNIKHRKIVQEIENQQEARVSGLYDVENGFMLDALIKDCNKGEKELAKENIENISKILDLQNCIIIFDGGYPGIDLIWYLEKLKIKMNLENLHNLLTIWQIQLNSQKKLEKTLLQMFRMS